MNRNALWFLLLSLACLVSTQEPDDAAAEVPEDGAEAAGDAAGEAGEDDNDEAWEYVKYLKEELNEKVEDILVTLYEAKDKRSNTILDETVTQTMNSVLEIRKSLLDRIKGLRNGDIQTDDQDIRQEEELVKLRMSVMTILLQLVEKDANTVDKLKMISDDLLELKRSISTEIMRILMLPTGQPSVRTGTGDCQCDSLKNIGMKIGELIKCTSDEEEDADEEGAAPAEADAAGDAAAEGGEEAPAECPADKPGFVLALIEINDAVDEEIEKLYNALIKSVTDEEREKFNKDLEDNKEIKNQIEKIISKILPQTEVDEIKSTLKRDLGRLDLEVKGRQEVCQATCPDSCDAHPCASELLKQLKEKMEDYETVFNITEDETQKKDYVRLDMIKYISEEINTRTREILMKEARGEELTTCDKDEKEIFEKVKKPLWLLVNTTIFYSMTELEAAVSVEKEMLDLIREEYCSGSGVAPRNPDDDPNCEWQEYEQTNEYIDMVDKLIQDSLFKPANDAAQMTALLAFVELQGKFEDRVKELFEDKLVCNEEVNKIKQEYMGMLNTCMAEFMNGKLKFTEMSRNDRIRCTKKLRTAMETRKGELLEKELEKSLNEINVGQNEAEAVTEA